MSPPTLPFLRRALAVLAATAAALTFIGCSTLDEQQRRWIFQPAADTWWAGANAARGMDDVWITFNSQETGQAAKLHGLWLAHAHPAAPVLLYLHGARWDVTGSAFRIRRLQALGFNVLAIDYRGFGKTSRELPSEAMAHEDARAAWDWLAAQHPGARRYIFGHSLGGAIAVELAAQVGDESGLIVESSFTSIRDVFHSMRWGWLPLSGLITQRFEAAERIGRVGSPVLVVHGSADRMIPPSLGQTLFERAAEPKRWLLVEGGSHHDANLRGQDAYREALRELFGLGS